MRLDKSAEILILREGLRPLRAERKEKSTLLLVLGFSDEMHVRKVRLSRSHASFHTVYVEYLHRKTEI